MIKTTNDVKLLNKLILATGKEIDYWLLEKDRKSREIEYGTRTYTLIRKRMEKLRKEFLEVVLAIVDTDQSLGL